MKLRRLVYPLLTFASHNLFYAKWSLLFYLAVVVDRQGKVCFWKRFGFQKHTNDLRFCPSMLCLLSSLLPSHVELTFMTAVGNTGILERDTQGYSLIDIQILPHLFSFKFSRNYIPNGARIKSLFVRFILSLVVFKSKDHRLE
jgi:hypothetical protein